MGLRKQKNVDHISPPIQVKEFEDILLDPVIHVKEYIRRTEALRKTLILFVTLNEPYKAETVAEWLSKVITLSGQKRTPGSV